MKVLLVFLLAGFAFGFTRPILPSNRVWGSSQLLQSRSAAAATTLMATAGNVLVREPVRTGGPAVLERPETARKERVEEPVKQRRRAGGEAWEVRIYNDGLNTREHVARSLVQVTGMSEINAYQTMMQAHQNGIAVVGRWCYEVAEMYHDALRKNGIVCDIVPVDEDM